MTLRDIPIIPTVIVAAAIATMIALGFWQIGRMEEKEALIAKAEQSARMSSEVGYPQNDEELEQRFYRRTTIACRRSQRCHHRRRDKLSRCRKAWPSG